MSAIAVKSTMDSLKQFPNPTHQVHLTADTATRVSVHILIPFRRDKELTVYILELLDVFARINQAKAGINMER